MSQELIVKVGKMPGQITEVALTVGTTIGEALSIAGLDANGFDVKVDGSKVGDVESATVTPSTKLIILAQRVKGNYNVGETATQSTYGTRTVKVGKMPGKIEEYAVEVGSTVQALLDTADLNPDGFDIKVDGAKIDDANSTTVTNSTNLVILAQRVKGNA